MKQIFATAIFSLFLVFPLAGASQELRDVKPGYKRPLTIPFPPSAPYSPQIATLGKMLFFDPRLSGGGNISCSTCHDPSFGWEVPAETPLGAMNTRLSRHSPTIINAAWGGPFFWDGRAATLEEQASGPITAPNEMNSSLDAVVERLSLVRDYQDWFDRIFPEQGLVPETVLVSLATFERTIVAGWSPFDRWVDGDASAISPEAVRGFLLFNGKAGCAGCHIGWNFSDNQFHRVGVLTDDIGRATVDKGDENALYSFKTQSLRNISLRAPYMHNGTFPDLTSVIRHYAEGGTVIEGLENEIAPFEITDAEIADLVAFLQTLTDSNNAVPTPILPAN